MRCHPLTSHYKAGLLRYLVVPSLTEHNPHGPVWCVILSPYADSTCDSWAVHLTEWCCVCLVLSVLCLAISCCLERGVSSLPTGWIGGDEKKYRCLELHYQWTWPNWGSSNTAFSNSKVYMLFKCLQTFTKIDNILVFETSHNKYNKIQIIRRYLLITAELTRNNRTISGESSNN